MQAKAVAWERYKQEAAAFGTCPSCGKQLANEDDSDCAERMDPELFFGRDRGIPPAIWKSRPFVWYTPEHPDPVLDALADLGREQRTFAAYLTGQCHGWSISREPPPMIPALPRIYPELKPLHPVHTDGPTLHWHGDGEMPEWMPDHVKMPGERHLWQAHINRSKKKSSDAHGGDNTDELHYHWPPAKYVHLNETKFDGAFAHHHDEVKTYKRHPDRLRKHLDRHEHPEGTVGLHVHAYRVADPTAPKMAQRIDAHSLAVELIRESPVVFYGIEGCLKADAILADGGAPISVPSVGQWDAAELEDVADAYLRDKTVVVVCDADWHDNRLVINEARLCESWLRRFGVSKTYVAAPPPRFHGKNTKGVDDLIGVGGHLEDLLVVERKMNPRLEPFIAALMGNKNGVLRNGKVLRNLANYVGESGCHYASLRRTASVMGLNYKAVERAIKALTAAGALLPPVGDLTIRRNHWSGRYEWDIPLLVLASDFCPQDLPERRLGLVLEDDNLSIRKPRASAA